VAIGPFYFTCLLFDGLMLLQLIADMDDSIKQLEEAAFAGGDVISVSALFKFLLLMSMTKR
jgi:hypothetical protein